MQFVKKFGLQQTGCQKCYFLVFAFFIFPNLKWLSSKPYFVKMNFEDAYEVLIYQKYFLSLLFCQWNDGSFKKFWNFHGNAFCFFIFSKWMKYYNLTLDDTFKILYCTVVHHANLNSSCSLNKHYLRAVEYAISFFSISCLCLF